MQVIILCFVTLVAGLILMELGEAFALLLSQLFEYSITGLVNLSVLIDEV